MPHTPLPTEYRVYSEQGPRALAFSTTELKTRRHAGTKNPDLVPLPRRRPPSPLQRAPIHGPRPVTLPPELNAPTNSPCTPAGWLGVCAASPWRSPPLAGLAAVELMTRPARADACVQTVAVAVARGAMAATRYTYVFARELVGSVSVESPRPPARHLFLAGRRRYPPHQGGRLVW